MAITSTPVSAKIRFTDGNNKTLATYTGIRPGVTVNSVVDFIDGMEMLRNKFYGFHYLITEDELKDVL